MDFLFDEAGLPVFDIASKTEWPPFLVVGAMLPYRSQKSWLKRYSRLPKGSTMTEEFAIEVLDFMKISCIRGVLIALDHRNISGREVEKFRADLLSDVYKFAKSEPIERSEALMYYCKEIELLSQQDFAKTFTFLETILRLIKQYLQSPRLVQSIDQRKIQTLIDDQCQRACPCLKNFLHFFLYIRSYQGHFNIPKESKAFRWYTRLDTQRRLLDSSRLLGNIQVFANGRLDDKFPQLKIADCLASITRRTIKGELSADVALKLTKILELREALHLRLDIEELDVNVPLNATEQVRIIFNK